MLLASWLLWRRSSTLPPLLTTELMERLKRAAECASHPQPPPPPPLLSGPRDNRRDLRRPPSGPRGRAAPGPCAGGTTACPGSTPSRRASRGPGGGRQGALVSHGVTWQPWPHAGPQGRFPHFPFFTETGGAAPSPLCCSASAPHCQRAAFKDRRTAEKLRK